MVSADVLVDPHTMTSTDNVCLTQFLVTCRASNMSSIRSKEGLFLERASRALDEAIGKDERLFDGVRAATLLSSWFYGMGRYPEVRNLVE